MCIKQTRYFLSLYSRDVNCALEAMISLHGAMEEFRTFKPREPLKAIFKIGFSCRVLLSLMNLVGLAGSPAGSCSLWEVGLLWSSSISTSHLKAAALPDVLVEQFCQPS